MMHVCCIILIHIVWLYISIVIMHVIAFTTMWYHNKISAHISVEKQKTTIQVDGWRLAYYEHINKYRSG